LPKGLGLTAAKSLIVKREIGRRLPGVPVTSSIAKRLAVFPDLGIVYNRIQKNANTTTMLILDSLEVGKVRTITQSKGQHVLLFKAWMQGRLKLEKARYMVVVRSPYGRALSAFLYKFHVRGQYALREYGREFDISPTGFCDFLHWLRDGALDMDLHWDLQLNSLALPVEVFTDIVHVENYQNDMRDFLARVQENRGGTPFDIDFDKFRKLGSPHATRSQDKSVEYRTPMSDKLIAELYAADFEAFGYDRV